MYSKLFYIFIFSLFVQHTSMHAMKRAPQDELQQEETKRIKLNPEPSELKWYSYAEIMTFIYKIKSLSLREKI